MMDKLCIEMIFANTSQTKGLIERYNGTVQRRLPNDIITVSNTRKIAEGNMFSYNVYYYVPYDKNG